MNIRMNNAKKAKPQGALGFGKYFTDHMFKMHYTVEKGWHDAEITPYEPLSLDPSTTVLHYGQGIFEGMKAYLAPSGEIKLFRPMENMNRMNRSCERMCIPTFPSEVVMEGLFELLKIEKEWIPTGDGESLYIRPSIVALDEALGVHAGHSYIFFIILSPVGAYYAEGLKPVSIYVEETFVRAAVGGTGEAKCIGNYAASLAAGEKAAKEGYSQVLWLDAKERKYVEEVGAMNMFFVIDGVVTTPKLTGSILPGITRKSILEIARTLGYKTEERLVSIEEVIEKAKSGACTEAFGTGTAAVISPVGMLHYKGEDVVINGGEMGAISRRMYDTLVGIQNSVVEDTFDYMVVVK